MRITYVALAGALLGLASPVLAQVPDTAAAIEMLRQQVLSGRISPEEVRARIQAAGLSEEEVRRRLRELGYPDNLLDQYLGIYMTPAGGVAQSPAQIEEVLRRLAVPPMGGEGVGDSLLLFPDTLVIDTTRPVAGEVGLRIFGKSLFERATTQFRPAAMGPVPPNYRLGPGDEVVLIMTGDVQEVYVLPITREGFVVIPNVGRVSVNGLTVEQLRNSLYTYLGRVYSGVVPGPEATTFFDISISTLRRNQIFVIGEVEQPAAYEVTSVATVLQALYQAGGPTDQGSFRNIQVRRGDRIVATLDIYEYLTQGVATGDIPLDQSDVIFVPVRGAWVRIDGNVLRPGIYELKGEEGLRALIELAGGVEPEADLRRVQIDRILPPEQREPGFQRKLLDVNVAGLLDGEGELEPLVAGDAVHVFAVSEERRNTLTIRGNVWAPGIYELVPEMRLSDLIEEAGGLKDDTYLGRAQVVRLNPLNLSHRLLAVSLAGGDDPLLKEYDEVKIYSVAEFRDRRFVTIYGAVQNPGVFEFREDMTLRDLVMAAGGLQDDAYLLEAEVARISSQPDSTGDFVDISTAALDSSYVISEPVAGDGVSGAPGFVLERFDNVFIRRRPGWELQRTVTVTGEVLFPGRYALNRKDERLSSVIERAGSLTQEGHADGIRFYRRMDSRAGEQDTLARVNIDLPAVLEDPRFKDNLILEDGDSIDIPEFVPMVRVEGAVLFPVSVMYKPKADLDYYINSAGGYARSGDKGRTRVEYANGSVRTVHKQLLIFKSKPKPEPGSRVFVPEKPPSAGINWIAVTAVVTSFATVYALLFK